MEVVDAPLFQTYEVPPAAVSVAEDPGQVTPSLSVIPEVSVAETEGVGSELTFIVTEETFVQMPDKLMVTE